MRTFSYIALFRRAGTTLELSKAMTPEKPDRPGGPATTGGQDAAIVFATQVGTVIFGLAIQSLLAYTLLPEGRGSFALCVVFAGVLSALFTPGAQQGAQYFVMTKQATVSEAVGTALAICLVAGALAVALTAPFVHSDVAFFHKAETRSFYLALALVPVMAFSGAMEYQLAGLRRFGYLAVFALVHVAVNIFVLLLLLWVGRLGVDGAVAAAVGAHACTVVLCAWYLRRRHGLVLTHPFRAVSARIVGYGLRFHPAGIGGVLEMSTGVLILGLFASQAEIGLFATASALMLRLRMISDAVGNALLPRIAGSGRPELTTLCLRVVSCGTAAAILAVLAISTPLVRILFSKAFLPAVPLLWIIAPGVLAYACAGILGTYFKGIGRPGICSWAASLGLAANLIAIPVLYPVAGVSAAAWGLTLGMICRLVLLAVAFTSATRMRWLSIWLPRPGDAVSSWRAFRAALGGG